MIKPSQAAALIARDYAMPRGAMYGELASMSHNGTDARIVQHDGDVVLIIRGSDDSRDWLRNFRVWSDVWPEQGHSGRRYHKGFLRGAREVWGFVDQRGLVFELGAPEPIDWRPRITHVIGHSRGAAIAGIIGASLGVPTITFASPRYIAGGPVHPGEARVTHYCRKDDFVCHAPPFMSRGGKTRWLDALWRWGATHAVKHYARWV